MAKLSTFLTHVNVNRLVINHQHWTQNYLSASYMLIIPQGVPYAILLQASPSPLWNTYCYTAPLSPYAHLLICMGSWSTPYELVTSAVLWCSTVGPDGATHHPVSVTLPATCKLTVVLSRQRCHTGLHSLSQGTHQPPSFCIYLHIYFTSPAFSWPFLPSDVA